MMTAHEIVERTIRYGCPERVARSFGDSDICWAGYTTRTHATDWHEVGAGRWERTDEWGNLWARLDPKWQKYACDEFIRRGVAFKYTKSRQGSALCRKENRRQSADSQRSP